MATFALIHFVLLSFLSGGLAQTSNGYPGLGNLQQVQHEPPRVVEVVRWRQPVCLTSAPGVLPCMVSFQHSGSSYQVNQHYSNGYPHHNRNLPKEAKPSEENLFKKLTQDDSGIDSSSSLDSIEEDNPLVKRSPRSASTPKLFSPRVVRSVELENLGPSNLGDRVFEGPRHARYLRFASPMARTEARRQTVYVTKVVDSPVVATLVATTCLPDIGIPLCDEIRDSPQGPGLSHGNQVSTVPVWPVSGPPQPGYVPPYYPINSSTHGSSPNNNGQQPAPQFPGFIQNIADFITQPNIVQANQTPEVKPVVVVQPTSPPGFFDGINAFLMPNGSWFGIFGGNATGAIQFPQFPQLPQLPLPQLPQLPQLPPLPEVPTLQQILYRPENDISDNPTILNIFNLTNNQNPPGAGPPTQSPGIFGGLFASPTRPEDIHKPTTTSTAAPSLLDGIGNIFRPTNRPLVIESPDQHPIVIERPVYVAEQPVIPGIFDILQFPNRPVRLNSTAEPEVIKDPVYVLQQNQGPFGGLLPNWNIFGTPTTTTTTTTTTSTSAPPTHTNHQNYYPSQHHVINSPPTYNGAVIAPINPHQPAYPNPPNVIPGYVNVNSPVSDGSLHSQSYGYSKSTGIVAAQSGYAVPIPNNETSTPDSVYSVTNLEESSVTPETDLLDGSLTEIVHSEGEPDANGIADDKFEVEDVLDTTLLSEDEAHQELKNIDLGSEIAKEIVKEIENEA